MIVTVCKFFFPKSQTKEIVYRNYKKCDVDAFQGELKLKLQSIDNYKSFESIFLSVLNKHAPLKKTFVRRNQVPYMTKKLRKAIMRCSELESKYLKNRTIDNKTKFRKQNNFCCKIYKKDHKKIFYNLGINKITDNKLFWKTIKPLPSDKCIQASTISLVKNTNVISDDFELAKTFKSYFEKAVMNLGIKVYESLDANPQSGF